MYRIDYLVGDTVYPIYEPFDSAYSITAGVYHRETNTIGRLTFSVPFNHPHSEELDEYRGEVRLFWNATLLYKFRIIKVFRGFQNTRDVTCEGLIGYLSDSIVRPYTFNESNWLYPVSTGVHSCTVSEFVTELIMLHNAQVTERQRFTFVDETNGAFDGVTFTTSQNAYVKTWDELESKVLKNVGGYIQLRFAADGNRMVLKASLAESNTQVVRFAVNLKNLSSDTAPQKFATALYPISAYTDANGNRQTTGIAGVNGGIDYVQDGNAVNRYGRIIEFVQYDGIVSAARLKAIAQRDLDAYLNRGRLISAAAVDMAVIDGSTPLEVDKMTRIISPVNGVDVTATLNAFDVDLLDPTQSTFTFNGEIPSFVRKSSNYRA
ncbi:MAG: phage tail protein [Ruminococcus sp.]|nr:phage tail protein [Ruminococcus sp.]